MRIEYKGIATQDIAKTKEYIEKILKNKQAAQKLVNTLVRSISLLADNPLMGMLLREKFDVETDIRFLLVAKYIVFCKVVWDTITILRVIDGRRVYMSVLFN